MEVLLINEQLEVFTKIVSEFEDLVKLTSLGYKVVTITGNRPTQFINNGWYGIDSLTEGV